VPKEQIAVSHQTPGLPQPGIQFAEIGSSDVDRSVDFYRSLLDFTPVDDVPWPHDKRVHWLSAGPAMIKIVDAGAGDLGGWKNDDLQRGMRHVGLKVGDVDRRAERLRDAGVRFTIEPTDAVGDVRLCFFTDPDGALLEFIDGHLTYHSVVSAELADRERLAAERRPRDAAPIFDHVAVTVADLDATVAYYRANLGYEVIGQLRHDQDPRGFLITYLAAGAGVLEVFTYTAAKQPAPGPPDESRLGLRGIGVGAGEPAGTVRRLAVPGATVVPVPPATASGPLIIDPDGVPLQVVAPAITAAQG
jgi:catechol 2,3-dioxygenase-like lactoylglutathione lyase family enzyme